MKKHVLGAAKLMLGPTYQPIRRALLFLYWLFPAMGKLFSKRPRNRLLVIYDISCQPFSIGDILVIQEASLVLRNQNHLDKVDFAMVYDPLHPASRDPAFAGINKQNATFHLASVLPVAQVNQHLGSLFAFDSHEHLERFITDNIDSYHTVWPPAWKYSMNF
jgi:hypothetical protein